MDPHEPEFKAAGCLVYNKKTKKYLLIQSEKAKRWGFPKGRYEEEDGTLLVAAARETKEESNLDVKIIPEIYEEIVLPWKNNSKKLIRIYISFIDYEEDRVICNPGEIMDHAWIEESEFVAKISHDYFKPMAEKLLKRAIEYFSS